MFTYKVSSPRIDGDVTKRKIVSCVAQLYDPNGFIAPVTILGKMIIQDLWRLSIGWDESVTGEMLETWNRYWREIEFLEKFEIPRWINVAKGDRVELHGFSDASSKAYGAVVYVRVSRPGQETKISLLIAKTRVAPLKTVTIPRLELAAAELLGRMIRKIIETMEWEDVEYTLWTDSEIVWHWLRKPPCTLKTFVANRVSSIQANTDVKRWKHISSGDNPADLLSRGLVARDLVNNELWLNGPPWLVLQPSEWKSNTPASDILDVGRIEMKVAHVTVQRKSELTLNTRIGQVPLLDYVRNWERAVNVIAFVWKFIGTFQIIRRRRGLRDTRIRKRRWDHVDVLQTSHADRDKAVREIIRRGQTEYYAKEIDMLRKMHKVQDGSRIEPLRPILDNDGVLRVGGRLSQSELSYETKHPIIVPNGSRLAWLLVDYAHRSTKHGGTQVMTQFIRERYWIPRIRNEIRRYIQKCVICARHEKRVESQLMADLPKDRVTCGKPFVIVGVDFAGPFRIKMINRQGKEIEKQKCWIAVFVCLKTRAIHLDIVSDLSTVAFIACYERFIARRGRCEKIYSDNGTTFKGAERELREAYKKWTEREMIDHLTVKGTDWKFMAPAAPHQGGIYEAAVKSMKFHLVRVVGLQTLTYEQLQTLLVSIEAILNSRPLYPLSQDVRDIQALTPGHFIVGEPLVLPLPFSMEGQPDVPATKMWRERKKMVEHFWTRWREEYLVTLQERKKWRRETEPIAVGQLVILKNENAPPAAWALGRIQRLIYSHDGKVRNVEVKTESSKFVRPVQKICIVPVDVAGSVNTIP